MRTDMASTARRGAISGLVALTLAAGLSAGCGSQGRWTKDDYQLSYGMPFRDRAGLTDLIQESELEPLSAKIYLVSDNQRHELLGGPIDFFRTSQTDIGASSAIRPPQLDLFGQDVLTEALTLTDGFVLHLGDACDISNTGEFARFAWDMRPIKDGWVMAPGNHDGFFYGNSSRERDSLIVEWNESGEVEEKDGTRIKSGMMQKDRYVACYLASLVLQDQVWSEPLAASLGSAGQRTYEAWARLTPEQRTFPRYWEALDKLQNAIFDDAYGPAEKTEGRFELAAARCPKDRPYLKRLEWKIDTDRLWRSFILQEVDITAPARPGAKAADPLSIVVLDTSQYRWQPSVDNAVISAIFSLPFTFFFTLQVAGTHGNILVNQKDALTSLAGTMKAEGRRWIVASHHPYYAMGRSTPPRFDWIRNAGGIPLTLSAHTHFGQLIWNHDDEREGDWLEINVGSLVDAPLEFRDFQVHRLGDKVAVHSERRMLEPLFAEQGLMCDDMPGCRPNHGDPDFYLTYQQGFDGSAEAADLTIKRTLLAAYLRMFRLLVPEDPGTNGTAWPNAPDGTKLTTHQQVIDAIASFLDRVGLEDTPVLNAFLYALRDYDETASRTPAEVEKRRAYRLSQAVWASRAELSTRGPRIAPIDPDISLVILPVPADARAKK